MKAIHILFAFAAYMEFKLYQIDVRDIFEWIPQGGSVYDSTPRFQLLGLEDHVYNMDRDLYGLKQALREWYGRLLMFLLENGFNRGKINNINFLKKKGKSLLIVQVYIDDNIFGATDASLCKEFSGPMGKEFEISITGELNFFLWLQIKQTSLGTLIH